MDIIWEGLFYGPTGYAEAARNYVLALTEAGARVRIVPRDSVLSPGPLGVALKEHLRAMESVDVAEDAPLIQHVQPPSFHLPLFGQPRKRIGYTVFETDRIPRSWVSPCCQMDEIWVPASFNRRSFAFSGVPIDKLHVIPHAIDTIRFTPDAVPLLVLNRRGFLFLSIFQWGRRKGWDLLLRAYLQAFSPQDDVSLLIKTEPAAQKELEAEVRMISRGKETPPILLDTGLMTWDNLPRLYTASNCLALPFRGDGFGLPIAEAMACGVPVIATHYGGPADFVDDETGYLVEVQELVSPDDAFCKGTGAESSHRWAEPSLTSLAQQMRRVFEEKEEAASRARSGRERVLERMSYPAIAALILEKLGTSPGQAQGPAPTIITAEGQASPRDTPAPTTTPPYSHTPTLPHPHTGTPAHSHTGTPTRASLLLDSPIGENWSFSVVGTGVALALERAGFDVHLRPWNRPLAKGAGEDVHRLLAKEEKECDLHLRVSHPDSLDALDGKKRVGITVCDTTVVPPEWVESCNRLDAVLVPSRFCAAVLLSHGVTAPLQVYPHGFDAEICSYFERPIREIFTFLFVAAAQKRKGVDLLIAAFREAFPSEQNVRLRLVSNPPYKLEHYRVTDPRINYSYGSHSLSQLARICQDSDCLVLPTRGGAFELTPLEAMATGLPVIVTGWSGPLEYANVENSYLLHIEGLEPAFEGRSEQGLWAIPSLAHLTELLRHVYTHQDEAREKGKRAAEQMHRDWTWDAVTTKVIPFLELML